MLSKYSLQSKVFLLNTVFVYDFLAKKVKRWSSSRIVPKWSCLYEEYNHFVNLKLNPDLVPFLAEDTHFTIMSHLVYGNYKLKVFLFELFGLFDSCKYSGDKLIISLAGVDFIYPLSVLEDSKGKRLAYLLELVMDYRSYDCGKELYDFKESMFMYKLDKGSSCDELSPYLTAKSIRELETLCDSI